MPPVSSVPEISALVQVIFPAFVSAKYVDEIEIRLLEIEIWPLSALIWLLTSPLETFSVMLLAFCEIDEERLDSALFARFVSCEIVLESSPSAT